MNPLRLAESNSSTSLMSSLLEILTAIWRSALFGPEHGVPIWMLTIRKVSVSSTREFEVTKPIAEVQSSSPTDASRSAIRPEASALASRQSDEQPPRPRAVVGHW